MLHNRCLALASLMLTSFLAAYAAPAQELDARLGLSAFDSPEISPVALPDAPSTTLRQTQEPAQPDQPQPSQTQSQTQTTPSAQSDPNSAPQSSEEQLKQQEHQRVFGVMAAFNTTRNHDALPLTPSQKFQLFFKSQTDPWPFALAVVVAGINQATDAFPAYGQGVQGYAKYYGAAYGDAFIGNLFGNAILTSWWHEDPRYFQKGTGSYTSRILWAASSTIWCKRDNGSWGPNYANVAGNLIGAAIANVYYPASERTVSDTITRGLTVSAQGIIGSEIIEFWPDMVRHYRKKQAEKAAKKAAQQDAQSSGASAPQSQ